MDNISYWLSVIVAITTTLVATIILAWRSLQLARNRNAERQVIIAKNPGQIVQFTTKESTPSKLSLGLMAVGIFIGECSGLYKNRQKSPEPYPLDLTTYRLGQWAKEPRKPRKASTKQHICTAPLDEITVIDILEKYCSGSTSARMRQAIASRIVGVTDRLYLGGGKYMSHDEKVISIRKELANESWDDSIGGMY